MQKSLTFLTTIAFLGLCNLKAQDTLHFDFTGESFQWVVPECVYMLSVEVAGAQGGGAELSEGGKGAKVNSFLNVTPGQILQINVGGAGTLGSNSGGWNGGGNGHDVDSASQYASGGGGGASDIRVFPYDLNNRVVVAGGGGGRNGGSLQYLLGGGNAGCISAPTAIGNFTVTGGGGGNQTSGGAGGPAWSGGIIGEAGALGQGGDGGYNSAEAHGGGGGGGLFGGGGGGTDNCCLGQNAGGPGGGGSSFPSNTCVENMNSGHGYVKISFIVGAVNLASNGGFYCEYSDIELYSNMPGSTDHYWTGPNGFESFDENPIVPGSNVSLNSSGFYTVTAEYQGCLVSGSTNVLIKDTTPPYFENLPDEICINNIPELPSYSDNDISGSWNPPSLDAQNTIYIFTPSLNECATQNYVYDVLITETIVPVFEVFGPYCVGSNIPPLPTTSLNGVPGSWFPTVNNLQTSVYYFTPAPGYCGVMIAQNVFIVNNLSPVIYLQGSDLIAPEGYESYLWSLNGIPIENATSNVLTVFQNGNYTLQVFDANGCFGSSSYQVNTLSLDENELTFNVYPNPSNGIVLVRAQLNSSNEKNELRIYNLLGDLVYETLLYNNLHEIDLSHLSNGVYYIKMNDNHMKIVLQ